MSYDELLAQVYAALPQLKGQLHAPRVVYVQSQGKVYITFESNVLVEEASFLKLEALLRRVFPQKPLALRVVSPGLKDDFLENISAYKQVLTDFLRRNYPASASWMSQIDWRCDGKRITLTFPDAFSLEYMGRQNVAARLSQAVKDIFSAEVMVELTVAGDQEKRLAEIREERLREQTVTYTPEQIAAMTQGDAKPAKEHKERKPSAPREKKPEQTTPERDPMLPVMTDHAIGKPIMGREFNAPILDTLSLSRKLLPELKSFKLKSVCKALSVSLKNAHRAVHDATATAYCLAKMFKIAKEEHGFTKLSDLNTLKGGAIGESYHVILLVKSQEGLVNLNRLVSIGHLDYFRRRPHMPRFMIDRYREGLIIGSACEAGELYRAVLENEPWEKIKEIASWYDYLEIQPVGNNAFLVREGRVADDEALRDINRKIVQLGDELGKPVVATGDVHFLDPHNAINRSIIQAGMGYDDADMQPPLYFKTTNEMLEEFAYLGAEKCHEVVIDNPRKIADQVDKLQLFPKHPKGEDTFQPFWEDAADNIQNMTWGTAKELYGDELPEIVVNRLNKELKSIIGYGFATLYNIAQRLVSKSNADGYLVGSRGSVGSSLVARMCGITEVNALPPHYRCTHCRKGFFDVDKSQYKVGVDLPDKDCPICGQKLVKDGFDIPFEVFLGFEGDKVPDIDLNFSGEYQNRAFHNVEELFGHDHVFRAGTITGLAEKTAYGYVSKYFEERGLQVGNTEKERLAAGCEGVKKTTGQHPGGMVVVPKEYEIYQFTAVQHPADDLNSDFTTTHFDFNSMHDILVKLDCLGHDDPTVLHMLEELTGIGYKDVPLDDPDVRSLFSSPKALGVTPEDIGCLTGTFGVPEFGTSFVRGMLDETKPTTMEELLRISGLSHGTDVWLGNAQELIANGTAKLSECVCCRDDIMNYLIDKGVAPKMAFTTMESVRKGRGLKPEMEQAMIEQHVPQWFMDSCKKIKYMFPKGHAVAYVTMALRVAWYKVHRPLAYYCAYFTVRGDGFDAMTMLIDPATIREKIKQIKADPKASAKDKEAVTSLELVLEMNMRGFKFLPCDLYKSDLKKFKMEGETGLRCPFTSLGGLGESAAINIVRERERGPFMSVEDLKERTRISSAVIELLRTHGSLEGLSETSQVCMF